MSLATVAVIRDRALNSKTGIAIFGAMGGIGSSEMGRQRSTAITAMPGGLDAVFAHTADCQRLIRQKNKFYICTIGAWMSPTLIDEVLERAVRRSGMMLG